MIKRLTTGRAAAGLVFLLLLAASPLNATTVRPMDLKELIKAADMILVGKVMKVESRFDEHGLPATFITIAVTEKIKGVKQDTVTIKQYGLQEVEASGRAVRPAGMPSYTQGEEVVLFLHRPSNLGFTSPVGLGQGKYTILRSPSGKSVIPNQLWNRHLFQTWTDGAVPAETAAQASSLEGQLQDYVTFLSAVKRAVQGASY